MVKIIKRLGTAMVLLVCAVFVLRCCMTADKSLFDTPIATDGLKSAFSDGETEIRTVSVKQELSGDGYFAAYGYYYNPESGEAQFAVRWNDSVYDYTDMAEGHEYVFYLWNETTGERYPATVTETKKRSIYNYRHLVVSGIPADDAHQITAVMELRDGYESTQVLKYAEQPYKNYKIPASLKKQLRGE